MKTILPLSLLISAVTITASLATVPSLINYQGRLTDSGGEPVTGSRSFTLSIYDASTSGVLLYTENIGVVTLDAKGIYSFQFGGTGTSNSLTSEAVGTTDGTATTFPKVLDNAPIVADSLSVTDGTYTWSQTAGSSNDNEFGVVYSEAQGRVTVIYYTAAPAAGAEITATYRHGTTGVTGALSGAGEQWLELSVDGTPQATRDRVLAVPFAKIAGSLCAKSYQNVPFNYFAYASYLLPTVGSYSRDTMDGPIFLPKTFPTNSSEFTEINLRHPVPFNATTITRIDCSYGNLNGVTTLKLISIDKLGAVSIIKEVTTSQDDSDVTLQGNWELDRSNYQYFIAIDVPHGVAVTVKKCSVSFQGTPVN